MTVTANDYAVGTIAMVDCDYDRPSSHRTGKVRAVYTSAGWVGLFPIPPEGAQYNRDGWCLTDSLTSHALEQAGIADLVPTHRGWCLSGVTNIEVEVKESPEVEVARLREELAKAKQELVDFKAQVIEVGGNAAERHDMCDAYEDVLSELGLPIGVDHEVEIEVRTRMKIKMHGRTVSTITDRVRDMSVDIDEYLQINLGSDYDYEVLSPHALSFDVVSA